MNRALLCFSLFVFVLFVTLGTGASAHELRPAYLELRQTEAETYDVLWKVPAQERICA